MRITSVGGGPAGLYAAILLAKADPANQVTVVERNPRDHTFGFGVVFSDQTLTTLRDADRRSHEQITAAFARWDAIDIRYRGQTIRCGGNGFSGLARRQLLDILQRRAEELGVRLLFATEADDPAALAAEADLLLGADGLGSPTRARFAATFQPRLTSHDARYIWLGTTKVFEAFTFSFRSNADGRFQAHAYPYDDRMSTFIVECDAASWRRAGLDQAGEADSIAYCADLFAEDLEGHKLIGNASRWISFVTVRNRSWHAGNVALVGDAAHTAHFSIGSGTKLAMEDAIALAGALEAHADLPAALAFYESERRPVVERMQEAAADSCAWFESTDRYLGFPPPQFAFSLLARSRRVTYDNLRRRDRVFAHALDRWFAAGAAGPGPAGTGAAAIGAAGAARAAGPDAAAIGTAGATGMVSQPPEVAPTPAFTPLRLRGRVFANRMVAAPCPADDAADGLPSDAWAGRLAAAGAGGAGLALAELVAVAAEARITSGCAGLWNRAQAERWRAIAAAVHQAGPAARFGLQLVHAGARGATRPRRWGTDWPLAEGGWPLVAASPLAYGPGSPLPAELDRAGMAAVAAAFVAAAERAATLGADLLELHFGHGYLLAGFLSPLTNRRADGYGGALAGRLRFPLELVAAVRACWPADRPLSVCLTAGDAAPGGLRPDDAVAAARALAEAGCDLVHVVAGQTTAASRPAYGRAFAAPLADLVRNRGRVPTLVAGNIATPAEVDTIVAAGRADLCVLGRPSLPDPPWLASTPSRPAPGWRPAPG